MAVPSAEPHRAVRPRIDFTRNVRPVSQSCARRICDRYRGLSRLIVHRLSNRQLSVLSTNTGAERPARGNIHTHWCGDYLLLEIDLPLTDSPRPNYCAKQ